MAEPEVSGYTNGNRAFLQAFMARNVMKLEDARPLVAAIQSVDRGQPVVDNDISLDDFESYISMANRGLSPLDLEIRSTLHQVTRDRIYALVNTTSDPMTQLATTYSADELGFIKIMLDHMFDGPANSRRTEAMCISSIEAVQLAKKVVSRRETQDGQSQAGKATMTGKEAEELLRKLVAEGWLERSNAGYYTLTPRALIELKTWLVDAYNDDDEEGDVAPSQQKIKFCHACKEIITMVGSSASTIESMLTFVS
jgi:non-structural maintenance of chromosomes element 1